MTDLRQAAQQALDYWEQVAWGDAVMADKMDALRAALAQQAEPVEPVAWLWKIKAVDEGPHTQQLYFFPGDDKPWSNGWTWTPLYTAPPQRKPLTDQEIDRIRADCVLTPHEYRDRAYGWALHFARAVERAHGIGEEK